MRNNKVCFLFFLSVLFSISNCSLDGQLPVNPLTTSANNQNPDISLFAVVPGNVLTNQTASLRVVATDPDYDNLSFTYSIVSGGGTLGGSDTSNGKTYNAPSMTGTAQVSVTVSDGKGGSTVSSTNISIVTGAGNRNPVIQTFTANSNTMKPGQTVLFTVVANDPDAGDSLYYSYEVVSGGGQLGGSFLSNESYRAGAPWTTGLKTVKVTVSDGIGGTAESSIDLTVEPNDHTVLKINEVYSAAGEDYFELKNNSSRDYFVETNTIRYGDSSHTNLMPAGTRIPANSYLMIYCDEPSDPHPGGNFEYIWTSPSEMFGLSSADTVRLYFGSTLLDSYSWTSQQDNISQSRLPDGTGAWDTTTMLTPGTNNRDMTNRSPAIDSMVIVPFTLLTNQTASIRLSVSDPDIGDTLSYAYSILSGGGSLGGSDTSNGKIYTAPNSTDTAVITVTVSDGNGGTATRSTNVNIVNGAGNQNPVIQSFTADRYSLLLGETVALTVTAVDPDAGTTLYYSYETVAGGGQFGGSTTSTETYYAGSPWTLGMKTVKVTVSDGMGGSAETNLNLTVDTQDDLVLKCNEVYSATGKDWFEVYNKSTTNFFVPVNGLQYGDSSHTTIIPAGTLIPAKGFLVIYPDDVTDPDPSGVTNYIWAPPGGNYGLGSSDLIRILRYGTGFLLDSYSWTTHFDNISKGRRPDGTGSWDLGCKPTPGATNEDYVP